MDNQINTQIILDFIKDNNLTKMQFCKNCGISLSSFNRVLSNQKFKLKTLVKILKYTKLKAKQILNY